MKDGAGKPITDPTNGRGYSTLCISMYHADRRRLDAFVDELKARGVYRANRSWLIRLALSRLTADDLRDVKP